MAVPLNCFESDAVVAPQAAAHDIGLTFGTSDHQTN